MATTMATPAASTSAAPNFSGMGLSDAIDSIGSAPAPDTTTTTDTPAPEPTDTPAAEPADDAQPPAETQDPPVVPEPEVEIGPLDEIKPDREADGGKTLHFAAAKAKALLAARDFQLRLQEAIPNATIEDLQDNFRRSVEIDRMLTDYESGDPERVGGVLDAWVNPQANPQTLMAFADHAPAKLFQSNPQAFQRLESNILRNWMEQAYRSGDQRRVEIAQNIDFVMNGKFRQAQELQQRDPLADERQRFNLERQQWNQQRQQETQQRLQQAVASKDEAVSSAVLAEIQKPLQAKGPDGKSIEERLSALPGGDKLAKFVVKELQDALGEAERANPAWKAQYDLAEQRFKDNPGDKARLEALVTMKRQFAAPIIAKHSKAVIEAVTGNFLSQNAATHQKMQQAANKTEPLNGGTPVQRATAQQKLADIKKRGGSLEEGFAALGI